MKSRRDIIKSGIGLACIIAAGKAPAAVVKSMLGTGGIKQVGAIEMPTAADYVQDGLIAMWDGIENGGWGISDDQARLVDLTGNQVNLALDEKNGSTFRTRRIISARSLVDAITSGEFTYEVISKDGFEKLSGWNYLLGTQYRTTSQLAFALRSIGSSVVNTTEYNLSINNIGRHHIFAKVIDGYLWVGNEVNSVRGRAFVSISESIANLGINALAGFTTGLGYNGYENAIRIYSRPLTDVELAYNYKIDKKRFGL